MKIIPQSVHCKDCDYRSLLFSDLDEENLETFNQRRREIFYGKGECIVREGAEINEFIYLKTGLVKIHKTGIDKNDHILSIAQPLDFVSLLSVLSKTYYEFSVTAIEESTVCALNIAFIESLVRKNGEFAWTFITKMNNICDNIITTRFNLSNKHLRGRIAYIILYFANKVYQNKLFELPLSRKEVGELINMTTENVIRILSEFRKDQIIRIDGKQIEILNEDLLRKICEVG